MKTRPLTVGAAIRNRRERAYLTQTELAVLAECSLATIVNYEHGGIPRNRSGVLPRVLSVLDELEAGR